MTQQPNGSLSEGQIQQLVAAGWWTSGDDRWFGPEQHPDPTHRAHFASGAVAPTQAGLQPAPQPMALDSFAPPTQERVAPVASAPADMPSFPPLEPPTATMHAVQEAPHSGTQQFGSPSPDGAPQAMAYVDTDTDASIGSAHPTTPPTEQPAAPPELSPLAQQMAEEARRKAGPPIAETDVANPSYKDEEWRRIVAANAAAMEAESPGRLKRGSGKRRQRLNWLPLSALLFAIAALIAFSYYVPSVRTTFIETKAQITGEQVPVTVRPVPVENGMAPVDVVVERATD